jgi:hypothetical protein
VRFSAFTIGYPILALEERNIFLNFLSIREQYTLETEREGRRHESISKILV